MPMRAKLSDKSQEYFLISKSKLGLFLIALSLVIINDQFISALLLKLFVNPNLLWIIRFTLLLFVFAIHFSDIFYYKSDLKYYLLFSIIFTIIITGFFISATKLEFLPNYAASHIYYILSIIYVWYILKFNFSSDFLKFLGKIFIIFGLVSSMGYLFLAPEEIRNPAEVNLNLISFPSYGFFAPLLVSYHRTILFNIIFILIILISYLAIDRSSLVASIIFYLVVRNFDFGISKVFSYAGWIILALIFTLFLGIIDAGKSTTETMLTGRGTIWLTMWAEFFNNDLPSIFFGNAGDYNDNAMRILTNSDIYSEWVNITLHFYQSHSVGLKTLWDYGFVGLFAILFLFKGNIRVSSVNSSAADALFISSLVIASLNSSTNLIKFDIFGFFMLFAIGYLRAEAHWDKRHATFGS